jgi:hypothetical protein
MEQFRQRVAATCHIGPLTADETEGYIAHRLKCAGSTGKPSFEPAAFGAVFSATQGIPRRINSICDRLLLAGFLGGKTHLTEADVATVVEEFALESKVPARQPVLAYGANASTPGGHAGADTDVDIDIDISHSRLDASQVDDMTRQIAALTADQRGDQLQRLERSLLRLERINVQTLGMLQKLVQSMKKPDEPNP